MKTIFTILFLIFFFNCNATDYYFSAAGSNSNAGTSSGAPWLTLSKLTTVTLAAGDHVYLRRGDVFTGGITIGQSGSSGNPITFDAYGSGVKPVITGFVTTSTAWASLGGGVYETTAAISTLSTCNIVTINGQPFAMGRYPNANAANKGYLTYQSGTNGTLTSNAISGITNFTGGEVVVRLQRYVMDRCVITAQSSTVVTYTPQSGITPTANFGFFFENHISTLDQFGEWYYNPSTKKLAVYFGAANPASYTVKASSIDNVVTASSKNYITFNNISLQGSNTAAISITGGTGFIVQNCDVTYHGIYGIQAVTTTGFTADANFVDWCYTSGIDARFTTTGSTIKNNTVNHTGMFAGMEWKKSNDDVWNAIASYTANTIIRRNSITGAGYNGIGTHVSNNMIIDSNYVDSTCLEKDDGGGIYTWTSGAHTNMKILNNIVLNCLGSAAGTSSTTPEGEGIYLDDNSNNIEVARNTVANCRRGIFAHNNTAINIHNNTVFNCSGYQFRGTYDASGMTGFTVQSNIFFSRDATQLVASHSGYSLTTFGSMDSNYYCRPTSEPNSINSTSSTAGGIIHVTIPATKYYSLDVWKTTYPSLDVHSNKTFTTVSDVSKIRFEYNNTGSTANISLNGNNYISVDGTAYSGTLNLPAYSSIILLQTTVCPSSGTTTAQKYHFSTLCGDDNRTPTQARNPATPWQTLAKATSYFASLLPGDTLAFNSGETFPGSLTPGRSGTAANPIVVTSYGTGSKPIFSGMSDVSGWTNISGNIWESSAITNTITSDIVTKDGTILAKGRYPNSDAANGGYLAISSVTGQTAVTVLSLPTTNNFTNAELVMRTSHYQIDRNLITNHNTTSHIITYSGSSGFTPTAGYGIFIQNSPLTLDKQNEWYYNPTTKKLRMYSTSIPTGIKISTVSNIVITSSRSYLKFENITFDGSNGNAVNFVNGTNITIQNCTFNNAGVSALQNSGCDRVTFQNNVVKNCMDGGVRINVSAFANNVLSNTFDSIACVLGLQQTDASHGNGIFVDATCDTLRVIGNSFTNIGYAGINFRSSDSLVIANNYFANWNTTTDDGGAIYGYGNTVSTNWGRVVKNNIIRNAVGAPLGTTAVPGSSTYSASFGIYWDKALGNITADSNHIHNAGRGAVFYNYLTHHINMRYNTLDSTQYLLYLNRDSANDITNNLFKKNILFTRGTQKAVWFENFKTSTRATFGVANAIDSNYIVHENTNITPFVSHTKSGTTSYSLATWRSDLGYEVRGDTVKTTSSNVIREDYSTSTDNVYSLTPYQWKNARRTTFASSNTLKPYKSEVLIRGLLTGQQPPVVSISATGSFTGPGNLTLTANATDPDGTITQVQFYNGAVLLNTDASSPYSYNWTNIPAGTYTLTAKATDNDGLTTTSNALIVTITNPLPVVSITSPPNGQSYTAPASVVIAVTATIATGTITKVNFYSGGVWIGTDNTSPYSFTWSSVPAGVYSLTAVGVSGYGDSTTSAAKSITVNSANIPPTVSLTSPSAGSSTNTNYTLAANASDADGTITQVQFFDNGVLLNTDVSAPYSTNQTLSVGTHTLQAKATDNNGAVSTSAPVTVTVLSPNVLPTVSITSPVNGANYAEPADVTVDVSANDSDGSIAAVHLYLNGVFAGNVTSLPYSFSLTGLTAGGYVLLARAVDDAGDSTTSTSVNISVIIPQRDDDTLQATATIVTPILCNGGTALVTVSATSGTEPYSGDIGDHNETAGVKTYIVEDANGLKDTVVLVVNEPGVLSATATVGSITKYKGTATAVINPIGGTAPFQYRLGAGTYQSSNTFVVKAGVYVVTVRDANGCTATTNFTVTQPKPGNNLIIHSATTYTNL